MLIISDTNILSSLASGDALSLLFRLFPRQVIYIPPAVHQELHYDRVKADGAEMIFPKA